MRGIRRTPVRDAYHAFLRMRWPWSLGLLAAAFIELNVVFAGLYLMTGGIAHAKAGSFVDMLYFSVQTSATIGYGAMYPVSHAANVLVVSEAVISLMFTAVATGLLFAKFSRPTARMVFSHQAVITPINGVPTLMFRIGNERGNAVVDAAIRLAFSRTEHTQEGERFYRMYDLALTRDRIPALSRTWTVMHPIVAGSLLCGATPESLAACEAELLVSVIGTDDTSMQPVHARHQYDHSELRWGMRHADVLSETPEGRLIVDLEQFHELVPGKATEDFPYPRPATRL